MLDGEVLRQAAMIGHSDVPTKGTLDGKPMDLGRVARFIFFLESRRAKVRYGPVFLQPAASFVMKI
jgi:hypothetical protein